MTACSLCAALGATSWKRPRTVRQNRDCHGNCVHTSDILTNPPPTLIGCGGYRIDYKSVVTRHHMTWYIIRTRRLRTVSSQTQTTGCCPKQVMVDEVDDE